MKYVNAYIVTRHYGGPEEGGWWFNAGEPLASVPVSDNGDPEVIREDLRVKFADLNREVAVYIEEEFATYFPKERPHYE